MIEIHDLQFGYGRSALYQGFSARVDKPGIYGIFGRNGSGKSSLLKLICGLLTPWSGRLRVLGWVPRERAAELLASVYFVAEEFHLPNLTPTQLAATQGVFYPRFSGQRFEEYLAELEVPAGSRFESMSLGQKKKAAIAFALATGTPLLLLDEPTNGLDIVGRARFRQLMQRPEHADRAVLISTHQAHDLESILSHVWFIDGGQLALSAEMAELEQQLQMGVAADVQSLNQAQLLYQEPMGQQWAYVARRTANGGDSGGSGSGGGVQLELLYKALSLERERMLAALAPQHQPARAQESA
ncbi:ABC transporter ATP-binding protein [Verminephrobacter aporrectodeae subsp. tuberculatae]|uniref:ABC transporter ATP-binding protein n=1 Tax=Verminephrobacter aporrectodeae subsp. tuberculatae TaxID=1110392 RepID=A0ABT3KXF6_9BURK|nr:ABC transporter ATP-binding protein [Verminephrobacter aporrectodeae]MCW5322975.1 ABC transporter ATP-binding protein [Verminephrobacter aporrectodeae subsp. tuberculatae]MCW8164995.1 ABC transporter ATP-binding protein [Verminephrobacter aporrectodeae subsp. tuberculatae]MCW8168362.1 ABC transporter ATP-binding protein [Verminephrobacter aporrectodeae subsp. tuberculatae]